MSEQNEGKESTQGASLASKNGGTPSRDAVTTESGRMNEDRTGLGQHPKDGKPRPSDGGGKDSAGQCQGAPHKSATRGGMTGGQPGDTDGPTEETADASGIDGGQFNDTSGVAGGYQDPAENNGKHGTGQTSAQAGEGKPKADPRGDH